VLLQPRIIIIGLLIRSRCLAIGQGVLYRLFIFDLVRLSLYPGFLILEGRLRAEQRCVEWR
jgi:hypothetical protein